MWVDSFLTYLQYECNYSPRTIEAYGDDLHEFEAFYKSQDDSADWRSIDSDMIRNWMMDLSERNIMPSSVNRKLSSLRTFYLFLKKKGWVLKNPASRVQGPKKNKPLPYFLKEKETEALMQRDLYPEGFAGARDYAVISVFYETGVRLSELVGLDERDIDWSACLLKVTGKRNKQRIIPFGPGLKETLEAYRIERGKFCLNTEDAFFVTDKGVRMNRASVSSVVRRYLSCVTTLKKRSPHVLRHTFATQMLNHNADLGALKELLGHESVATTEVYTHTTFEELKKIYKQAHPRA